MTLKDRLEESAKEYGPTDAMWEDGVDIIEDEITDSGRWLVYKRAIVKSGEEYCAIEYDEGATEYQDSSGSYEIYEVVPTEVTVTQYVKK